jgi:HEAT repeat protein
VNHLSPSGAQFVAEQLIDGLWTAPGPSAEALLPESPGPAGWLRALGDGSAQVRAAASGRFRERPELVSQAVLAAMTKALADAHEEVRLESARTIGSWRGGAASAVAATALAPLLDDASEPVRWAAAQALARARPPLPALLPFLVRALESRDEYVRSYASYTLGESGSMARDAVPALAGALRSPEAWGAAGAALALGKIGPAASDAVPALIPWLSSAEAVVRARAAQVLGMIGPGARASVSSLLPGVADADGAVRLQSVRALGRIGALDEDARRVLAGAARDSDPDVRAEAAAALATRDAR